jgi:hypothetical protein
MGLQLNSARIARLPGSLVLIRELHYRKNPILELRKLNLGVSYEKEF